MKLYIVFRFDPMQCGACGNGNLDKIFGTMEEAQAYVRATGNRRGVSWKVDERILESYVVEELEGV